jgi:hypothetical protein
MKEILKLVLSAFAILAIVLFLVEVMANMFLDI